MREPVEKSAHTWSIRALEPMDRMWMRPSSASLAPAWGDELCTSAAAGLLFSTKRESWLVPMFGINEVNSQVEVKPTFVSVCFLLLLLRQPQPHRGTEAAGHVGPAVLPNKGQVERSDEPGRRAEVAWSVLSFSLSASRRQLALPEWTDAFAPGGAVLPGAWGQPSGRRRAKDQWKG